MADDAEMTLGPCLAILRPALLSARRGRETLVVCGAAQGMTSVVSFILARSGVFIGDSLDPMNHEDRAIRRMFLGPGRQGPLAGISELTRLISARNAAHSRWGFKLPRAVNHLAELEPMLRDPVIVVCLRNPLAVMRSIRDRQIEGHERGIWLAQRGLAAMAALHAALPRLTAPVVLCDMDAARADPQGFVTGISTALGLQNDTPALAAEIAQPGYRALTPR